MRRRISCAWRVVATYLGFLTFYTGGLVIAATAITACRLVPGEREAKELRVQRTIHVVFRAFIAYLWVLGAYTYSREDVERLRSKRGCLIVANHPTLLDVVFLISALPHADCVVKKAVWNNVFMRASARGAGYIPNDEGTELVDACAARLRRGRLVLLFPEGTRSPAGALRRFQRGAARVALRSGAPIVPVVITCEPPMLLKGMRWHQVAPRRSHYAFTVGEPILPEPYLVDGKETPGGVRRLTARLEEFYAHALGYGG